MPLTTIRPPEETRKVAVEDGFTAFDIYLDAVRRGDIEGQMQALTLLNESRERYERTH